MESRGGSAGELDCCMGAVRARLGEVEGNLADGEAYAGAMAGMITETVSAGEVVRNIIEDSEALLARLQ